MASVVASKGRISVVRPSDATAVVYTAQTRGHVNVCATNSVAVREHSMTTWEGSKSKSTLLCAHLAMLAFPMIFQKHGGGAGCAPHRTASYLSRGTEIGKVCWACVGTLEFSGIISRKKNSPKHALHMTQ